MSHREPCYKCNDDKRPDEKPKRCMKKDCEECDKKEEPKQEFRKRGCEKKECEKKDCHGCKKDCKKDHECRPCEETRSPRCEEPKKQKRLCHVCPKPREDGEEIDTVRVGVFSGSQPNADIVESNECQRAVGFDVELAWEIYHNRLGYCVEFYHVDVQNVGLNQLLCGLIDVVASSTVNITEERLLLANYIQTDSEPQPLAAIYQSNQGIACGPNTLRDLWVQVGGPAGLTGCPTQTNFKIARNSLGTVQSNILRSALSLAYPNCAALDAYYLQQTVDVRQFTCDEIVAGFNTLYQAAVIGPRGDFSQMNVIFMELDAIFPGQYELCSQVATIPSEGRGWAIRSCKLAFETQYALDEIICDGTYASLVAQAASFPLFTEECLLAGAGQTFLVAPSKSLLSVTSGFIDTACVMCLCKLCLREVKCPANKAVVRLHPLVSRIQCEDPFDCCTCECESLECDCHC